MAFKFTSTGSAITDALKEYMVEREVKRRTAEQDAMVVQREARLKAHDEASTRNMEENTRTLGEQRAAAIEENKRATAERERVTDLAPFRIGDEDPTGVIAKKYPAWFPQAAPTQGAHLGQDDQGIDQYDVNPGKQNFKGTPAERTTADDKARRAAYIKTLDPKSQEARFATAQDALGDSSLPYQLYQDQQQGRVFQQGRDGSIGVLDSSTGQVRPLGPQDPPFNRDVDQIITEPSAPSSNTTVNMGSDAVDLAAWQYLQTGTMPPLGMGAGGLRTQILERAAALAKEGNINPQANAASYKADQNALTQITRNMTAINAFKETARLNIGVLKSTIDSVPDWGSTVLNRPVRAVMTMAGSPEMAKFKTSLAAVQPEIARILNNPNLTGVLTDSARLEAQALLRGDYTVKQMLAAIDILYLDMENRGTALADQKAALEASIRGRGPNGGAPSTGGGDPAAEARALIAERRARRGQK